MRKMVVVAVLLLASYIYTSAQEVGVRFGVAGEIGLEYRFKGVPLSVGVDWRPKLSIVEVTDLHSEGFGFNIRYVFGKK